MSLRPDQLRRYARHLFLPEVGVKGQLRLLAATVRVEEATFAGAVAIEYLAAAGVGTIVVAADTAEVEAVRRRVAELNPDVRVVAAESLGAGSEAHAPGAARSDAPYRIAAHGPVDAVTALELGAAAAGRVIRDIVVGAKADAHDDRDVVAAAEGGPR